MKYLALIGGLVALAALLLVTFLARSEAAREAAEAVGSRAMQRSEGVAGGGAPPVESGGELRASVEALRTEVAALRRLVEELGAAGAHAGRREPVDAAPERTPAELRDELARLEGTVRTGFAELRALIELGERHALVESIRSNRRDVDWTAWEEIIAAWNRDPEEARKAVKLLTSDELIERFGPPTDVWANQMGLTWQYERVHPLNPDRTQEVILRLPDGYVAQLAVRELDREPSGD